MQDNLVQITNLTFARGERRIFDSVDMVMPRGKITAIMGPSGSGKTTLLRLIGAQLYPQAGKIFIDGANIHQLSRKELYLARRKMGLLFQSSALFTHLSVFENVAFPLREHTNLNEAMLRDIVLMKLEAVGLRGAAQLMPDELSGGMARRVALARTIALDPELMMYDEPFTGQDPISMGVLVRLIQRLNQLLQTTTIIVSHDVEETCSIADYIYLIAGGKVIGHGTPFELKKSDQPQVKQFMHGEADGVVPFHYPARPYTEELLDA
ncbi:ATP-binding cassette domain-containing protein [Legionella brunensis]|uniref:ATP-binding cassette domain-containing protein n=1 Tax=Legionella brunensis TaxID=29422 RepID=UPI0007309057